MLTAVGIFVVTESTELADPIPFEFGDIIQVACPAEQFDVTLWPMGYRHRDIDSPELQLTFSAHDFLIPLSLVIVLLPPHARLS